VLLAVGHQHRRVGQFFADDGVVAGDADPDGAVDLGDWTREWGLVVPDGNPDDVAGIADLVDRELRFVNRTTDSGLRTTDSGLRMTLGNAVAALADDRGAERHDLVEVIDGFEFAVRAHESPARKVLAGEADAGLGLRSTAEALGTGFVPCGEERVRAFAAEERREKPGVRQLERAYRGRRRRPRVAAGIRPVIPTPPSANAGQPDAEEGTAEGHADEPESPPPGRHRLGCYGSARRKPRPSGQG